MGPVLPARHTTAVQGRLHAEAWTRPTRLRGGPEGLRCLPTYTGLASLGRGQLWAGAALNSGLAQSSWAGSLTKAVWRASCSRRPAALAFSASRGKAQRVAGTQRRSGGGLAWGALKPPCAGCAAPAQRVPPAPGRLSLLRPEKGPGGAPGPHGPSPWGAPAAPRRPRGAAEMAVTAPQSVAEEQSSGKLLMKSSGRPIIGKPERSESGKNNKKI